MRIGPVGAVGTSPVSGIGYAAAGGGAESIRKKIDDLEKQKSELEKQKQNSMTDRSEIDQRIAGIDKRINNLQSRLDKLDAKDDGKCETCENRRYQDGSDDPGVSFKSATRVSPEAADAAVRGHEMEHVNRNQAKAAREGKRVVSQSVTIKRAICPECGKAYTAGGVTKTVTKPKPEDKFNVGKEDEGSAKGSIFDSVA